MLVQTDSGDYLSLISFRDAFNGFAQLKMFLFVNDYHPLTTTSQADMVVATFPGFSAQLITGWAGPDAVLPIPFIYANPLTFIRTATGTPQTVYGYWCERIDAAGTPVFCERFATPVVMASNGDAVTIFPRYTQDSFFKGP